MSKLSLLKNSPASTFPSAKIVGQVLSSTADAKHVLSRWIPSLMIVVTRSCYCQNSGDPKLKVELHVLLVARKFQSNPLLQTGVEYARLSTTLTS